MSRREKILLVTIVSTIVIIVVVTIINQNLIIRIKYYESREGLVIRLMNKSSEEEYRNLLSTSEKYFLIGLVSLLICLGSIGLYISSIDKRDRLNT